MTQDGAKAWIELGKLLDALRRQPVKLKVRAPTTTRTDLDDSGFCSPEGDDPTMTFYEDDSWELDDYEGWDTSI